MTNALEDVFFTPFPDVVALITGTDGATADDLAALLSTDPVVTVALALNKVFVVLLLFEIVTPPPPLLPPEPSPIVVVGVVLLLLLEDSTEAPLTTVVASSPETSISSPPAVDAELTAA
jgi:hypothetical protein